MEKNSREITAEALLQTAVSSIIFYDFFHFTISWLVHLAQFPRQHNDFLIEFYGKVS